VRSGAKLRLTLAALERRGCSITVRYADEHRHRLEDLARDAEPDFDAVVVAGGDGSVDAAVNGLAAAPVRSPSPLGILPLGTVNLLAREIGLPRDPDRLAAAIVSAPVRQLWPGRVGERLFMVVASSGYDADVVAAVDPALKMRLGRLAFAPAILNTLRQNRQRNLSVRIDGRDERAAAVIVAKGRYYAGPFMIAREAAVTEPFLHAALLRSDDRTALVRCLVAGLCGMLHRLPDIEIRRCTTVSIDGEGAPVQADGEIVGSTPVTITVAERPLDVIWP
jgi:diacylglycerol kinase family enzyme